MQPLNTNSDQSNQGFPLEKSLIETTRTFYQKVKSIYEESGYESSFPLNVFWADQNMPSLKKIILESPTAESAILEIQKTWFFSVNTSKPIKDKAIDWLLDEQRSRGIDLFKMDPEIQESPFSNRDNNVERNGRLLTPDFLRTVSITQEIKKHFDLPADGFRIIELGAGTGHLARILKLLFPNNSHVILDIPETLFFSHIFLKLNFPEAKFLFITGPEDAEKLQNASYDFVFVPTKFADIFLNSKFDLFLNTASLGEMKNSIIRHWMDFIQQKVKVNYLFTLNRFLNTIHSSGTHTWRLEENECSVSYDSDWEIIHWELEPSYTRSPYLDTIIARYVEICAHRPPSHSTLQTDVSKKERSTALTYQVLEEDWAINKTADPIMTYQDNILINDLSMKGTLFKLWESIRLLPQSSNVSLMLKYLETLNHKQDREFEETYFYENLFETLTENETEEEILKFRQIIHLKKQARKIQTLLLTYSNYSDEQSIFSPRLLKEGYRGFNIVLFSNKFYAISQTAGPIVDWHLYDFKLLEKKLQCFIGSSLEEVQNTIDGQVFKNSLKENEIDNKKLQILTATLNQRTKEIQNLESRINDLQSTSASLTKEIEIKAEAMAALEVLVQKKGIDIKSLENLVKSKNADINTKTKIIEDLEKRVEKKGEDIKSLEKRVEKGNADIRSLDTEIQTKVKSIDGLTAELDLFKSTRWYRLMSWLGERGVKFLN